PFSTRPSPDAWSHWKTTPTWHAPAERGAGSALSAGACQVGGWGFGRPSYFSLDSISECGPGRPGQALIVESVLGITSFPDNDPSADDVADPVRGNLSFAPLGQRLLEKAALSQPIRIANHERPLVEPVIPADPVDGLLGRSPSSRHFFPAARFRYFIL